MFKRSVFLFCFVFHLGLTFFFPLLYFNRRLNLVLIKNMMIKVISKSFPKCRDFVGERLTSVSVPGFLM